VLVAVEKEGEGEGEEGGSAADTAADTLAETDGGIRERYLGDDSRRRAVLDSVDDGGGVIRAVEARVGAEVDAEVEVEVAVALGITAGVVADIQVFLWSFSSCSSCVVSRWILA
jgi:hypothetical protein